VGFLPFFLLALFLSFWICLVLARLLRLFSSFGFAVGLCDAVLNRWIRLFVVDLWSWCSSLEDVLLFESLDFLGVILFDDNVLLFGLFVFVWNVRAGRTARELG